MLWASLRNAKVQTGCTSLAISSYTQFARKSKSRTSCLLTRERNRLKIKESRKKKHPTKNQAKYLLKKRRLREGRASVLPFQEEWRKLSIPLSLWSQAQEKHLMPQSIKGLVQWIYRGLFPPRVSFKAIPIYTAALWRQAAWFGWVSVLTAVPQEISWMCSGLCAAGASSDPQPETCLTSSNC